MLGCCFQIDLFPRRPERCGIEWPRMWITRLEQAAEQHILDSARETTISGAAPRPVRVGKPRRLLLPAHLRQCLP